jgi:hypothetical protein
MASDTIVEDYALEEMKEVRDRINAEIDWMNRYEALSIALVGAIFALIFQYKISDRVALFAISAIPMLVSFYGYKRYRSHAQIIRKYNSYLTHLEEWIRSKDKSFVGLVTFYESSKIRSNIRSQRTNFWLAIFFASLALMLFTQWDPERLAAAVRSTTLK